ncbi:SUMO-conjugating enzyme ubc9 [Thelohanellus kitauei]|uniref:SUMO-conjugating enzyme ubc9 n=1 Tax=Thelohanellus kitauei TaxID=669202 RepID=A0A0C2IPL6_THEKT|nr:SUMO-conjugating enzyme ubc9 [Thelohanellus kitauei]
MSDLCTQRLLRERKELASNPLGFSATPIKNTNGALDLSVWEASIPGRVGVHLVVMSRPHWRESISKFHSCLMNFTLLVHLNVYKLRLLGYFKPPIFHPNVYPNGTVCLKLLNDTWNPTFTILSILKEIQRMLTDPNINSPANKIASQNFQLDDISF